MKTIAAGLMFLLLFPIAGANAGSGNGHHARECANNFWGCNGRYRRHVRRHHHHHDNGNGNGNGHHHHHAHVERLHHGAQCHSRRRVVGEERTSKAKALRAAEFAWMGAVRYDHGERFQDLNFAKNTLRNCDPSSILDQRVRCVVEATPCRAPVGSTDVRIERRGGREDDDDDDKGGS